MMQCVYGPCYKFSDHKVGDVIRFRDTELGELQGTILWICGPGPVASTDMPAHYIVDANGSFPDTVFFNDVVGGIGTQDVPMLEKCPYCEGLHPSGQVEQCPRKRRK